MTAITEEERSIILKILKKHVPGCEVRAFGSRHKGPAVKAYSDLDLAVCGKEKLANEVIDDMCYDFQVSDLPFRVDIMDYLALSPGFRVIVDRDYEVMEV